MNKSITSLRIASLVFLAFIIVFTVVSWDSLTTGEGWGMIGLFSLSSFGLGALALDVFRQLYLRQFPIAWKVLAGLVFLF